MKNILLGLALTASTFAQAQNPVIQTRYTADPAPLATKDACRFLLDVSVACVFDNRHGELD